MRSVQCRVWSLKRSLEFEVSVEMCRVGVGDVE